MSCLTIASTPRSMVADERLLALAGLTGVPAESMFLQDVHTPHALRNLLERQPLASCLALHAVTLRFIHGMLRPGTTLQDLLNDRIRDVFVYGAAAADGVNEAVLAESNGTLRIDESLLSPPRDFTFTEVAKQLCPHFCRQKIPTVDREPTRVFSPQATHSSFDTIISGNELPVFVRFRGTARALLMTTADIPDPEEPIRCEAELDGNYLSLLPPLIFLRHSFPEHCWRGAEPTARLIIDDPLLKDRYGALEFSALKSSMQRLRYGVSIAFIPRNYLRTSATTANRLLGNDANLSICTHGCDHTNREFATGGPAVLAAKASLGMRRMEEHSKRISFPFEDVMVFPQGAFSKASLVAVRSANFLAAVNSSCLPADCAPGELRLSDFLWPAITRFDGFPVFPRRYPTSTFGSAFDLFLGRPALLVEHHEYFRDGCKTLEQFVAELQQIEPQLTWPDLSTQLMRTHLTRYGHNQAKEVRFFTRRFQFAPGANNAAHYKLTKYEPEPTAVTDVAVDGKSASFGHQDGFLTLELASDSQQVRNVEVFYADQPPLPARSFGFLYNTRALTRRRLSEFRDNTLSRHKSVLTVTEKLAKSIKATSGHG